VRAGFMRDDLFLCVHEQFMTDTAKLADIVLPATTFLEHDDMYRAGGHSFFQVTRKVIEPYAESRENHYVICELANRLGAKHRGFDMTAWEIIDETLKLSGYPDAETLHRDHWLVSPTDSRRAMANSISNPNGKRVVNTTRKCPPCPTTWKA
jgi:anaerobic selenocysteine-containing dehydrogenase